MLCHYSHQSQSSLAVLNNSHTYHHYYSQISAALIFFRDTCCSTSSAVDGAGRAAILAGKSLATLLFTPVVLVMELSTCLRYKALAIISAYVEIHNHVLLLLYIYTVRYTELSRHVYNQASCRSVCQVQFTHLLCMGMFLEKEQVRHATLHCAYSTFWRIPSSHLW